MKRIIIGVLLVQMSIVSRAQSGDLQTVKEYLCASYLRILNEDASLRRRIADIGRYADNPDIMVRELKEGVDYKRVKKYFSTIGNDGSWADLDYNDKSRSGWQPSFHAERLALLAKAYRDPQGKFWGYKPLGRTIHQAMKYWFDGNLKCRNWWYNQIGVPKMMGNVFLLMETEMDSWEKSKAIGYMSNARLGMTGQNSVWLAENVLVKSLLERNDSLFAEARTVILKELKIHPTGEGIRPDLSFHQHGAQLQFGNYGLAFANSMAYWARIFSGTKYALTPGQTKVLRDYLLQGMQWIIWKGYMDISSCGRQLFPKAQEGKAISLGRALQNMMVADSAHVWEYKQFYNRHIVGTGKENILVGNIYFPYSDFGVHRTTGWCATLKMSSRRVIGSEIVNAENLCGCYLGDGALYVYKTGKEYEDIFPVWDWTKIPGVTCSDDQKIFEKRTIYKNQSDFVGGVSDGRIGTAAMQLDKNGVRAQKTYFFTTDAIVCSGNGISCNRPFEVTTSVEQCLKRGRIRNWQRQDGSQAYYHNGNVYLFPGVQQVHFTAGKQTGSWRKVAAFADTLLVEKKVFKLWLTHGKAPDNASYQYVIIPQVSARGWKKSVLHLSVSFITQNKNIRGIRRKDTWSVVFFKPGTMDLDAGKNIKFSSEDAGMAMLEKNGKDWKLSACDPTGQSTMLIFRFSGKWAGATCKYNEERNETTVSVPLTERQGQVVINQI